MIQTQMFNGPLSKVREQLNAVPDVGQEAHVVLYTEVSSDQAGLPARSPRPTLAEMQAKNAEAIAYLQERLKNPLTDPEEIRQADEEFEELQRNLNQNRIDAGERPLFPE